MNRRYFVLVICFQALSCNLNAKSVFVEIPQSCNKVNWNIKSTESESSFLITSAVYQSLISLGSKGTIMPNLAESWQIISPLQIKFKLKNDIYFTNGKKIESQDAKNSLEQILTKTEFTKTILGNIKNLEIIDNKLFYLNLLRPDPLILQKISVFFRLYFLRDNAALSKKMIIWCPGQVPGNLFQRRKINILLNRFQWLRVIF